MSIKEVTKDNYDYYKNKLLQLEDKVKSDMVSQGIGDLFFTTGEDIADYVYDPRHHVYVMTDENDEVIAQTYLIGPGSHIQGDYSDLPKYYTMDDGFLGYVKDKYDSDFEFSNILMSMYRAKICAFKFALKNIYGSYDYNSFLKDLENELKSDTHFDERTLLRRNINKYMSSFMKKNGLDELYRRFYYVSDPSNYDISSFAYDSFLEASKVTVYNMHINNPKDYYDASVDNTIEVDTYITDPEARRHGSAKILSALALSKTISEFFDNNDSDILYLSITLHKDNYLSENVAHFFGFNDFIDLERRATIERKAYMKRIDRNSYKDYISYLNKKLAYFYSFGDEFVSDDEKEMFEYEKYLHNEDVVSEIESRLDNDEFDLDTRKFVMNVRDNFKLENIKRR